MEELRSCFTRTQTWAQAGKYLSALAGELPSRNGWSIAEHAGDRSPDATQRLLNRASWDEKAAMSQARRHAVAGLDEAARRSRRKRLVRAATSSDEAWGGRTAVNLPALTVTVADMVAALEQAAGPEASALIDWVPDPGLSAMMTNWPARIRAGRAARLGLTPDPDFGSVIGMHLAGTRP